LGSAGKRGYREKGKKKSDLSFGGDFKNIVGENRIKLLGKKGLSWLTGHLTYDEASDKERRSFKKRRQVIMLGRAWV